MRALTGLLTPLTALLLLGSCGTPEQGVCLDGGSSCAAADAPAGMRQVLKGHHLVGVEWTGKTNKESGVPDIGIKGQWAPITERR
jgi:hypothetical protein